MMYKTFSEEYETVRITYPKELNLKCPVCGGKVKFEYADNGRLVHTLQGNINQITDRYSCTNLSCELSNFVFNPSPHFDYGARHFGADVFKLTAEECLIYELKPAQILKKLTKKHALEISIDTIRRMCDDIIMLKATKIDEKTIEIVRAQGCILLGFDGQDPGDNLPSIWNFMDLLSDRVLNTHKFESLDYLILRDKIDAIGTFYGVPVIGWVSDKEGVITKCHDIFYPNLPHQYCHYHFLKNTWSHLEALDSNMYLPLKKTINQLYIHTASKSTKIYFEGVGKLSVREVFKSVDNDLQSMARARNKLFKELRGKQLYEDLTDYVKRAETLVEPLDPTLRFAQISTKTLTALRNTLNEVKPYYEDACELNDCFQRVRTVLGEDAPTKNQKETGFKAAYEAISSRIKELDPAFTLENCTSFLANKATSKIEILGEWHRLGYSYLPGLFQYCSFPAAFKTNSALEKGFSKEKQALHGRVAKGNVSYMIATRGEHYLRLKHCTEEELEADIVEQYSEEVLLQLRETMREDIQRATSGWRSKRCVQEGFKIALESYCQKKGIKTRENLFVG